MHKSLRAVAALSIGVLALAGCSNGGDTNASSNQAGKDGTIKVVTTTDVYADVVKQIGGDSVEVTPIINSTSQDPHSYEASAADRLKVKDANLVVLNGGGYDKFLEDMAGVDNKDQKVVSAVKASGLLSDEEISELSDAYDHGDHGSDHSHEADHDHAGHDHGSLNEHVWYSTEGMKKVAEEVAHDLGEVDAQNKDKYQKSAEHFGQQMDQLTHDTEAIKADGKHFISPEPVPNYLLETAGFKNATPSDLAEAVESESDIAPLTMQETKQELQHGDVKFFGYNEQTTTKQTDELLQTAKQNKVATASFTETLPEGKNYVQWMTENVENVKKAVA